MQSILILSIVFFAASGLPIKELVHSNRILEPSTLPASRYSLKLGRPDLNTTELIFGGIRAKFGQFPMQAEISYTSSDGKQRSCGGSIISATHILTAAHCTYDLNPPSLSMVGSVSYDVESQNDQFRAISRVVTHPGFDVNNTERLDDIAVIEISPPFEFNDFVKAATIVSDDEALLQKPTAVVTGYGVYRVENKTGVYSTTLLYTEVDLFPFSFCNESWDGALKDTQFCAGAAGRGAALGDSGGPIQVRYNGELVQVGITSFGATNVEDVEHNQDKVPSVFTRVSKYCDFIDEATRGVVICGNVPTTVAPSTTAF